MPQTPIAHPPASATMQPEHGGASQQYLTFSIGSEMFAVGILNVKEIIEYGNLTHIPMMPQFIRGVINLRGAVVPVIDLGARFSGKLSDIRRRTCIIIMELHEQNETHDIGVMVDGVSAVLDIPDCDIEPAPTFGARIRADFIAAMGKLGGRFVVILAIERVLSVDEMALLARISHDTQETTQAT